MFQLSEMEAAQISVKDLEQKVPLLEHSNMANRDQLLRELQKRHEKEMIGLSNQLDSFKAKLNSKVCCRETLWCGTHINA
jgi:hypothetical protein